MKTVAVTAGTAGTLAAGAALAGVTIATAPVLATVAAAVGVGIIADKLYDWVAEDSVKSRFSQAYDWFTR